MLLVTVPSSGYDLSSMIAPPLFETGVIQFAAPPLFETGVKLMTAPPRFERGFLFCVMNTEKIGRNLVILIQISSVSGHRVL